MSQTVLITGANRGIGFEMTKQAAARGNKIIACTRNAISQRWLRWPATTPLSPFSG